MWWIILSGSVATYALWWWQWKSPQAGWWAAWGVLVYVLFMHSSFLSERRQMWGKWQKHWETAWQQTQTQLETEKAAMKEALQRSWESDRQAILEAYLPRYTPGMASPIQQLKDQVESCLHRVQVVERKRHQ